MLSSGWLPFFMINMEIIMCVADPPEYFLQLLGRM